MQEAHPEHPQFEAEGDPLLNHLFQQVNTLMQARLHPLLHTLLRQGTGGCCGALIGHASHAQEKRALNRANEQLLRENMLLQELLDYLSGDMTQAEQ